MDNIIKKSIYDSFKINIIKELLNKYNTLNINMSYENYEKFIINRVNIYCNDKNFNIKYIEYDKYISRNISKKKKNKCIARLWNSSLGGQCSHKIHKNNLCKTHLNMIDKYGLLRFGVIDDVRPNKDLINGNNLIWN